MIYKLMLIVGAVGACFSINTVQSLLWLIVTFLVGAVFMLELGGEFLAILLILVYIGAIAVLFLFVAMLLNLRKVELTSLIFNYFPIGIFVGLLLLLECLFLVYLFFIDFSSSVSYMNWVYFVDYISNIMNIGYLLFVFYWYFFIILGYILLLALLGVVLLVR